MFGASIVRSPAMTLSRVASPRKSWRRQLSSKEHLTEPLAWCGALAAVVLALVSVDFVSQDPDSALYAAISARLAGLPARVWIAPEWWGLWGGEGPYREHPVGVFLMPALLGKLGFPPMQAAFAIGAVFSLVSLLLLRRVASLIVGAQGAAAVPWVALILPVAFINRIRATQEYPVLALMLLAIYATEKSRTSAVWIAVSVVAACATALVKGIFVVFVPIVCGLWLLCFRDGERDDRRAWLGLALSVAAVVLCTIAYEGLYRRATGDSFLYFYLSYRLNQIASIAQAGTTLMMRTLNNLVWYSVRLLWFGFPGTLALLVAAATPKRVDRRNAAHREVQGLYFAVSTAAAHLAVMSLGTTRAERYILPAYFAAGIAGALVAARRWEWSARLMERLARLKPQALALAWLLLILAALPFELFLPYVKFRP
jgi:4-amino-4-deoxy-L-arabinose transferase-like glycosyltransferase